MSASGSFDLEGFLRLDTSNFESGAEQAQQSMDEVAEEAQETADTVEQSMGDRLAGVGDRMQRIGGAMSAAITAPMALIGQSSLQAASQAEEAESKFENVFSNTAAEVREFADTFADEIGRSEQTIENQAAAFGSLLAPMIENEEQVADLSKRFTELTQDLASFENRNPAQVQRDLQSALAGQSETMRKYGVDLSEARLKQMGLTDESTRAEEAQLRLQAIIEDTQSAQGNAAETSESYANQMRHVRESLKDARIEIGQELLPIAKDLLDDAILPAIEAFTALDDSTQRTIITIGGVAAALGPLLVVFGTALTLIPAIASGFSTLAGAASTAAGGLAALSGPVGIAIAAIGALAAAWTTNFLGIRDKTKALIDFLATDFVSGVQSAIDNVISVVQGVIDFFTTDLVNGIQSAIDNAVSVVQGFADAVSSALKTLRSWIASAWDLHPLSDTVQAVVTAIVGGGGVGGIIGAFTQDIRSLLNTLRLWVASAWDLHPLSDTIETVVTAIVGGSGEEATGIIPSFIQSVRNALNTLRSWIVSAWNLHPLSDIIETATDTAVSAVTALGEGVVSRLQTLRSWVADQWPFGNVLGGIFESVRDFAGDSISGVVEFISGTLGDLIGWIKQRFAFGEAIADTVSDALNWAAEKVRDWIDTVAGYLEALPGVDDVVGALPSVPDFDFGGGGGGGSGPGGLDPDSDDGGSYDGGGGSSGGSETPDFGGGGSSGGSEAPDPGSGGGSSGGSPSDGDSEIDYVPGPGGPGGPRDTSPGGVAEGASPTDVARALNNQNIIGSGVTSPIEEAMGEGVINPYTDGFEFRPQDISISGDGSITNVDWTTAALRYLLANRDFDSRGDAERWLADKWTDYGRSRPDSYYPIIDHIYDPFEFSITGTEKNPDLEGAVTDDVPQPPLTSEALPSLDVGGVIERAGAAILHAGERVIPAAGVSDRGGGGGGITIESITINASGRAEGRAAGEALKRELKRFDI